MHAVEMNKLLIVNCIQLQMMENYFKLPILDEVLAQAHGIGDNLTTALTDCNDQFTPEIEIFIRRLEEVIVDRPGVAGLPLGSVPILPLRTLLQTS